MLLFLLSRWRFLMYPKFHLTDFVWILINAGSLISKACQMNYTFLINMECFFAVKLSHCVCVALHNKMIGDKQVLRRPLSSPIFLHLSLIFIFFQLYSELIIS